MGRLKRDDLKASLDAINVVPSALPKRLQEWEVRARNILDDDLGLFDDSTCFNYDLDDTTRDRLIAHSRQDIAMVYYALVSAEAEARYARFLSWITLLVSLAVLYKVW
jgi:hypothetical protein